MNPRTSRFVYIAVAVALVIGVGAGFAARSLDEQQVGEPGRDGDRRADDARLIDLDHRLAHADLREGRAGSRDGRRSPAGRALGGTTLSASRRRRSSRPIGTGFEIDSNGNIMTAEHVVSGASTIKVTFQDGSTVNATLVGSDSSTDSAVIHVDVPAIQLHPLTLGNSSTRAAGPDGRGDRDAAQPELLRDA